MVVRSVYRLIDSFKVFAGNESEFQKNIKINVMMTSIHIVLILIYTVLDFLTNNIFRGVDVNNKINPAWVCFSGLLDIILSYMIFFIFDEKSDETSDLVNDLRFRISYQVYDVIDINETQ